MRPAQPTQRAGHRGDAHLLAVGLLPPGAVVFQGGIGMGCELGAERVLLFWPDVALRARNGLGGQGAFQS
jgi:hypothetical protein